MKTIYRKKDKDTLFCGISNGTEQITFCISEQIMTGSDVSFEELEDGYEDSTKQEWMYQFNACNISPTALEKLSNSFFLMRLMMG